MNKPIITSAAEAQLSQSNANSLAALFDLDHLKEKLIYPMMEASDTEHQTRESVVFDDGTCEYTDVYGMLFRDNSLGVITLVATNHRSECHEAIGIFPIAPGTTQKVKINEVQVWDNQVCATIQCSVEDYNFAFFAADFYRNKEKYFENEYLDIELVAFAPRAEEAESVFSFEGQQAVEWLAKMGHEPIYNEDGTVQPVEVCITDMVAYLTLEEKAPEEAQFQSPAGPVETITFLAMDYYKTTIGIRGDGADIRVPVYFHKEFIPNLEEGMPISGYSCLNGRIAE